MNASRLATFAFVIAELSLAIDADFVRAASPCLSIGGSTASPVLVGTELSFVAQCCSAVHALPHHEAWLLGGLLCAVGLLTTRSGARALFGSLLLIASLSARTAAGQSCAGSFQWQAQSTSQSFTGTGPTFSFTPTSPGTFVVSLSGNGEVANQITVQVVQDEASVRQWQQVAESGDNNEAVSVTLSPLAAGSTLVAFTSEPNFNGNPSGTGTPNPVTVSDSAGNKYTLLNVTNDSAAGILQANQSFGLTNVAATSQPVTVTASFNNNQWLALVVIEVTGVGPSPVLTAVGSFVSNTSTTPSSDSTPSMSLGGPALVLALGANEAVALVAPTAGAGFTSLAPVWNWGGAEGTCNCPSALLEYATFAGPGTVAATFTPASSGANMMNLAVSVGY